MRHLRRWLRIWWAGVRYGPDGDPCRMCEAERRHVGPAPTTTEDDDASVWLVGDASDTPGYHLVADGTFHVLAPTSIAQDVADILNVGARTTRSVGPAPTTTEPDHE